MSGHRLDQVEFIDNPEPRCAVVLRLDTSYSMSGQPLDNFNAKIITFKRATKEIELAGLHVEVSIMTFGGHVSVVQPFVTVGNFESPTLMVNGNTPMGEAVDKGLALLNERNVQGTPMPPQQQAPDLRAEGIKLMLGGVREQQVEPAPATVEQIGEGHPRRTQERVGNRIGEQLEIERAAAQLARGSFGRQGVDEFLHAGQVANEQVGRAGINGLGRRASCIHPRPVVQGDCPCGRWQAPRIALESVEHAFKVTPGIARQSRVDLGQGGQQAGRAGGGGCCRWEEHRGGEAERRTRPILGGGRGRVAIGVRLDPAKDAFQRVIGLELPLGIGQAAVGWGGGSLQPREPRPQPVEGSRGCRVCHGFSHDADAARNGDHLRTV